MDNVEYSLYIVATPIGNMEDITLRALNCLKKVDFILCEDTRQSIKLLNHFGISKPLVSYHKFNEAQISDSITEKLLEGQTAALISDAGTPLISDPGHILIKKLIENNISFCVLPGANAVLPSIIKSGFSTEKFLFAGFLPSKTNDRKKALEKYMHSEYPVILYAAPHELKKLLKLMDDTAPEVELCINKELTKLYEDCFYGTASELLETMPEEIRGEYTVVVNANLEQKKYDNCDIENEFSDLIQRGKTKKEALKEIADKTNISKKELYSLLMKKDV